MAVFTSFLYLSSSPPTHIHTCWIILKQILEMISYTNNLLHIAKQRHFQKQYYNSIHLDFLTIMFLIASNIVLSSQSLDFLRNEFVSFFQIIDQTCFKNCMRFKTFIRDLLPFCSSHLSYRKTHMHMFLIVYLRYHLTFFSTRFL